MKNMLQYIITIYLFSNFLLTFGQSNIQKIKLAVQWLPQSQFAGYYIGIEKDIYKKYGFDVEIIHPEPGVSSYDMLLENKADFATMFLSTAMFLKSYGFQIVNVGQLSQKCAQVIVTKDKGISEPSGLNGMKIGIWRSGFDEIAKAFVKKYNLNVDFIPLNSTINLFLFGGINAITTMWYNEYHSILNSGINKDELKIFFFADYGFDVPEDGIYCLKNNYDKDTVERFVKATLEAWDYAFAHPEESIELVKKEMIAMHIPFNKSHQMWMLNRMNDLFNVPGKKHLPGELPRSDFDNAYRIFLSLEKIETDFSYEDFYYGIK